MIALATGVSYLDLNFHQVPRVIATAVLHGAGGVALIDPGPSSSLDALRRTLGASGIQLSDVTTILLTHIHLDHAGAVGTLVRDQPHLRVWVHEKGAPHMVNPEKLLASATRLWGDQTAALWGDVLPVPAKHLDVLQGGERIEAGGSELDVAYTPGHASHHVSYFSRSSGIAFVGDVAGIRLRPGGAVLPPTPPPDIDLALWHESLARVAAWRPETLFLTHFGPSSPVADHLSEQGDRLEWLAALAKRLLDQPATDEEREASFIEQVRRELRRTMSEADAHMYETAGRFDLSWKGLVRYWRKRAGV